MPYDFRSMSGMKLRPYWSNRGFPTRPQREKSQLMKRTYRQFFILNTWRPRVPRMRRPSNTTYSAPSRLTASFSLSPKSSACGAVKRTQPSAVPFSEMTIGNAPPADSSTVLATGTSLFHVRNVADLTTCPFAARRTS